MKVSKYKKLNLYGGGKKKRNIKKEKKKKKKKMALVALKLVFQRR